jgi:hypothetical protein
LLQQKFGQGEEFSAKAIPKKVWWDRVEKKITSVVYFSDKTEGAYGYVHGGAITAAIDIVFGMCACMGISSDFIFD